MDKKLIDFTKYKMSRIVDRINELGGMSEFNLVKMEPIFVSRCLCGQRVKYDVRRLVHKDTHEEISVGHDCWERLQGVYPQQCDDITTEHQSHGGWVCSDCSEGYATCLCLNLSLCLCCGTLVESAKYHDYPDNLRGCDDCQEIRDKYTTRYPIPRVVHISNVHGNKTYYFKGY